MDNYYLITLRHESLWPRGVLLFWAPNRAGYSSTLERAGKYDREEAQDICRNCDEVYMVPCEEVEKEAVRVVDYDLKHRWCNVQHTTREGAL